MSNYRRAAVPGAVYFFGVALADRRSRLLVKSLKSNGISEPFVNTLKRDYVRVTPLPDAEAVLDLVGGSIERITRTTTRTQG